LNESTFHSLVTSKPGKGATQSRYQALAPEEAVKVTVTPEGKIQSRFFTADNTARIDLTVLPYWGGKGAAPLEKLELPIKARTQKKDGTEGPMRYVALSTINEDHIQDPNKRGKLSLYSGRYTAFINAVGSDVLNLESLRELKRRNTSSRGAAAATITTDDVLRAHLGLSDSWLPDEALEFKDLSADAVSDVNAKIIELQMAARA
jgi:hypothetical protein